MELLFVIFGQTPPLPHRYLSQSFGCICKLYSWPRLNIPQGAEARQRPFRGVRKGEVTGGYKSSSPTGRRGLRPLGLKGRGVPSSDRTDWLADRTAVCTARRNNWNKLMSPGIYECGRGMER